ncbi:MAG: aspartate--tRNA(Asn) ligase [Candidatus Gottesmanbacteria bacterium]
MDRILISETPNLIDQKVKLLGWVNSKRNHGKIIFIDLRDRSGLVQIVGGQDLNALRLEDVVEINGLVKKRPQTMVNPKILTGQIEIECQEIKVVSKAQELPFDMGQEELKVSLPTLLDYRSLTLRHPRVKKIFQVQAAIIEGFRQSAQKLDCVEVVVPTIAASSTEGGADVFSIDYFGKKAFLTQSPQLYKQILITVFERVFVITKAYRAEPSVTTRHLTEATQMDCEFCFVEFADLLNLLEQVGTETLRYVQDKCKKILEEFGVEPLSFGKIPRLTLREAQEVIFKEFKRDVRGEKDLGPQDEMDIGKWALKNYQSDLVTITHFPTKKRAFYTMPDPQDPEYSLSYDLLFRGLEILSGSQRINDYDELVKAISDRGMDPKNFAMYLMAFKYGMPPEGGFSFGLERMTKNILNLENIRQASLFPRDMERVDMRLSQDTTSSLRAKRSNLYDEIISLLDSNNIKYETFEHQPVFTSEEAAKIRGTKLSQGAKALIMIGDKNPIMVVLPADRKADFKKIKSSLEIKNLEMATPEDVKEVSGVEIGAVPPFGNLLGIPLYVDIHLKGEKEIVFNAGLHTKSIKMKCDDFEKVTSPIIGDYS